MPGGSLTPLQLETHFGEELLGNRLGRGFGVVKGLTPNRRKINQFFSWHCSRRVPSPWDFFHPAYVRRSSLGFL